MHLASVPCEIYLLKLFGHTWKVKQMVHQQHSDTSAHTHTHNTIKRARERGAPLYPPFSPLLLSIPPPFLPTPLYVLSLCLPISGHGRLLFRHFKQI